jgi:acyl carrier protein
MITKNHIEISRTILEKILGMHREDFKSDQVLFDIIDWDSLKHVQLIVELESILGKSLEIEEIEALTMVGDLHRLLMKNLAP